MDTDQLRNTDRLEALHRSGLLERPGEAALERLARLASRLLDAPTALVSVVAADRQVFVGQHGLGEPYASQRETPLSHSFCKHVVANNEALVVTDARIHPMLAKNPAVRDLSIVAYLGVPLHTPDGHVVGSLCAIDTKERVWSDSDVELLYDLAASVMNEIALRHELALRQRAEEARELMVGELNHRVRNLFALVLGLVQDAPAKEASVRAFQAALVRRMSALVDAHSLVFESTTLDGAFGDGAEFGALAQAVLSPVAGSDRIARSGAKVRLSGRQALYGALLLHELAVNAAKHGALSLPRGKVELSWRRMGDEVHIDWMERFGPPAIAPAVSGFGTELIEIVTAKLKRADRGLCFGPAGLVARLGLPLV